MSGASRIDPDLLGRVRLALADDRAVPTPGRVAALVRDVGGVLGDEGLLAAVDAISAELVGVGPLEALLTDPEVSDILVNGSSGVWVDRGAGLVRTAVQIGDDEEVRRLAVRLAAAAGRRLDDASPWVDARLPDGTRLHAILPPLVQGGPHLSLRVPRRVSLGLADLVAAGTVSPVAETVLRALVAKRAAYVVTGGTGAGKTTLLAALLALVPSAERIVLVEDSAELRVEHPHVVHLEGRSANVEGVGSVEMTALVRQALRMRPDRLVVGEVRGAEVRELLAALNTGHEGGCGTLHANASTDLPARLEALGSLAGLGRGAIHAQAASALEVVVHMGRRGPHRHVAEVGLLQPSASGLRVEPAVVAAGPGERAEHPGPAWPALARRLGLGP